jgi:ribosomal protein S21
MTINVEVHKSVNENSVSLLRRFTKRVQGAGILPRMRSIRYSARNISESVKRKKTLKVLRKRVDVAKQLRLGKVVENVRSRR